MHRLISLTIALFWATGTLAQEVPFEVTEVATFNEPWAMTFLPDGRLPTALLPDCRASPSLPLGLLD